MDIEKVKKRSEAFSKQLDTDCRCLERNIECLKAALDQTLKTKREHDAHWDRFFKDVENGLHD